MQSLGRIAGFDGDDLTDGELVGRRGIAVFVDRRAAVEMDFDAIDADRGEAADHADDADRPVGDRHAGSADASAAVGRRCAGSADAVGGRCARAANAARIGLALGRAAGAANAAAGCMVFAGLLRIDADRGGPGRQRQDGEEQGQQVGLHFPAGES